MASLAFGGGVWLSPKNTPQKSHVVQMSTGLTIPSVRGSEKAACLVFGERISNKLVNKVPIWKKAILWGKGRSGTGRHCEFFLLLCKNKLIIAEWFC